MAYDMNGIQITNGTAETQTTGNDSTSIATTAFVQTELGDYSVTSHEHDTLEYSAATKIEAVATGVDVTGVLSVSADTNQLKLFDTNNTDDVLDYGLIQFNNGKLGLFVDDDDGIVYTVLKGTLNGSTEVSYAGTVKLATTTGGVDVTGDITVSGTVDTVDIASFKSAYDSHTHTGSTISALDAGDITTGTLPLARGGTNGTTAAAARTQLYVPQRNGGDATGDWGINVTGSSASCTGNAATASQLYINNDDTGDTVCPILFTQSGGAANRSVYEDSTLYFDNTNNILRTPRIISSGNIMVDGTDPYVEIDSSDAGSARLFLRNTEGGAIIYADAADLYLGQTGIDSSTVQDTWIRCLNDSSVTLYHNNAPKLATSATGVDITGNLIASGYVSGTRGVFTQTTGTAPLTVQSTTHVGSLNADYVDGYHATTANSASTIAVRDASKVITATTFSGALSGNATTATWLTKTYLTSAVSLDSYSSDGMYYWSSSSPTNNPFGGYCNMLMQSDGQPQQLVWGGATEGGMRLGMRRKNSGTWANTWTEFLSVKNGITGRTALTSGIASTDELLISDGGTMKRMDVSVLHSYLTDGLFVSASGDRFGVLPGISSAGVMEIGYIIDFHGTDTGTDDYDYRIACNTTGANPSLYFQNDAGTNTHQFNNNGNITVSGSTTLQSISDIRIKNILGNIDDGSVLSTIARWSTIKYAFNDLVKPHMREFSDTDELGLIAQEVVKDYPEVIDKTDFFTTDGKEYMFVKYEKLVPVLFAAFKEQIDVNKKLEDRLTALEKRL